FSSSLGMSCEDCHAADDRKWENFQVDNPRKRMARRMILMMQEINKTNFGGRQMVTCYSCHRGADKPRTAPDLTVLYGGMPQPDNAVNAWPAGTRRPVAVLPRAGKDLEGARADAMLMFPSNIKTTLNNLKTGFPSVIDDKDVNLVQGTTPAGTVVSLYFDDQ